MVDDALRRAGKRGRALSSLGDRWDNDDVRVRPGRRTRPRTKTRPRHSDAVPALVTTVDRGRYGCLVAAAGQAPERVVTAMRARELGRRAVAVGDRVDLVGDTSGAPDTLARIVRIAERTSVLRRSADDTDPTERVLVANADQLVIVTSVAEPPPRSGFIDRCLVAAYTGNLEPLLLITKADLADPAELIAAYADLDLPMLVSRRVPGGRELSPESVAGIADRLHDRMSVLVGQSGVGKSTLVNVLVPAAVRATGTVSGVGKGRHTTTAAVALRLPDGGWVIDTPGVRSFGLAHVLAEDLLEAFDDLVPATAECPPGCDHGGPGIGCALDGLVATGGASPGRLASFRRLLASRGDIDTEPTATTPREIAGGMDGPVGLDGPEQVRAGGRD